MPAGFQVIGDHGVTQIDENYTNYALKHAGRTVVYGSVDITLGELMNPIFCVRTLDGNGIFISSNQTIPNVTYTLKSGIDPWAQSTVEWYVFDQTVPADGNAGLSIYRENGSLAYSTSWNVMKVGAVAQVPDRTNDEYPPDGRVWAPYAGKWAVCLSSARGAVVPNGSGYVGDFIYDGAATDDYGAETVPIPINRIPWRDDQGVVITQGRGGSLILVDVTNLLS